MEASSEQRKWKSESSGAELASQEAIPSPTQHVRTYLTACTDLDTSAPISHPRACPRGSPILVRPVSNLRLPHDRISCFSRICAQSVGARRRGGAHTGDWRTPAIRSVTCAHGCQLSRL